MVDNHANFSNIQTHENGIFLYQSFHADAAVKWGKLDYIPFYLAILWAFGKTNAMLPFFVSLLFVPKRHAVMIHFTWHAELLPHTEQVVFHKAGAFGGIKRFYVDIKSLEKVTADAVINPLAWDNNLFDDEFVWHDRRSGEVFVFDKLGVWNKKALEHPLLY